MLTRRRFALGACTASLAATLCLRGHADEDRLPDGSQSRDVLTPEALRAIDRGLAHLAGSQHADGSFGERQYHGHVAVTSLAGLALMAGGHQPGRGQYGEIVTRALQFVLSKENKHPAGFLHNPSSAAQGGPMYSHGFGALFLAEAHGTITDPALQRRNRETLARATQLIVSTQNEEGGWRYQPEPRQADISVTICQIMALRSARNAGLFVPKKTVDNCVKYVRACQLSDGGFSYFKGTGTSAFARSAAGLVALYSAGVYQGREIDKALAYLKQYKPGVVQYRRDVPDVHYYYGQYYAAQAMWTAGGRHWQEWFPAIRDELLSRNRMRSEGVWIDPSVCNHYATAMALIILQIPNNYLPILQK